MDPKKALREAMVSVCEFWIGIEEPGPEVEAIKEVLALVKKATDSELEVMDIVEKVALATKSHEDIRKVVMDIEKVALEPAKKDGDEDLD